MIIEYRTMILIFKAYLKKFGSPKIGSAKPVRSLIPDRFFETITTLFRTT